MKDETFFENFELFIDTPNGVQKLRGLILQLAMQGKLVPQNPNEEPVSMLLERFKSKKELLIKENKIRKSKQFPSIKPEEFPHVLAKGWVWMRLGEIGDWAIGSGFPKASQGHKDKPFLFCKVSDMNLPGNEKWIRHTQNTIDEEIAYKIKARINPPGTVIFPKIGGAIATNKRRILDKPSAIDNNCLGIISIDVCNTEWLYQLLNSIDFTEFQVGTSIPAINQGTLGMIVIGVPPLEEQKRIVAKIDQLMALCDQLEARQQKKHEQRTLLNSAALDKLLTAPTPGDFAQHWQRICDNFDLLYDAPETVGQLRQAILQLAVQGILVMQDSGDETAAVLLEKINAEKEQLLREKKIKKTKENGEILKGEYITPIPKNWTLSKIVDLGFVTKLAGFEYTKHIKLEDYGEVPVIRAQNVRMNNIDESKLKYIDMDTSNLLDRCALTKKAILMTFIGAGIGDVAIFDKNERWHLAPNVAKIEPFNQYEEKIHLKYLLYYLMSNTGRYEIFKFRKATAQPSLSMGTIRQVIVALPPFNEQKRIVAKVDQLMILCDELEAGLVQAQTDGGKLMEAVVHHVLAE